jgi:hypothetical protein
MTSFATYYVDSDLIRMGLGLEAGLPPPSAVPDLQSQVRYEAFHRMGLVALFSVANLLRLNLNLMAVVCLVH